MSATQQRRTPFFSRQAGSPVAAAVVCLLVIMVGIPAAAAEPLRHTPTETIQGHPALPRSPRHTTTAAGHAGDAVNVAFIGTEDELHHVLAQIGRAHV